MILEEAIRERDFSNALIALGNGEKLPSDLNIHLRAMLYEILIEEKQFDILHLFAHHKIIETDIYEYDSFDHSFFYAFFNSRKIDDELNDFFDVFVGHFTNINDEIKGYTLISYAFIKSANLRNIQALINFGCDASFRNHEDENILHQLVKSDEGIYRMSSESYYDLFKAYTDILIGQGIEIDEPNTINETALLSALRFRKVNLATILLEHGANPNHVDHDGNNAFYYAIIWNHSLDAYLKLSEYASPELNEVNSLGQTVLFNYVTEINFDSMETNQAIIKQLINDGADLYKAGNRYGEQRTTLDMAAGKSVEILQAILETGNIDLNAQDSHGNTLLHKVRAYNVNEDHDKAKDTYRKVKLLLENGADAGISNDEDKTALMLASDDNYKIKTVELLMKQS
ncbi:ankyrin repeat domain-containing protein [Pedobacter frigidisoli]|uniref:Ankyrin repeat domain-containing protein n=1 Tax=Pedobacter frigidisoli TaxID=2530455 RepID=A0A4R0P328_9SPHI|nr:ankyrin repeat domain-containing protein [Pedobacter frigidisoli]TCD11255.1 ankyrin repeat domain-containing protein [Pedobacter frigidisoli]